MLTIAVIALVAGGLLLMLTARDRPEHKPAPVRIETRDPRRRR
ncbi:hypothetical protein [Marinobacterium aestuariivivens]|uniref:Uncharacterized protein n=1 Tax=Marinobacterium aestuariivivens TaxID=1698799 RepID=A0ABW1ZUD9_9GAMM